MTNKERIQLLAREQMLQDKDFRALLTSLTKEEEQLLYQEADRVRRQHYGNTVYLRGLIEFSNFCRNDCLYCGLRRSNKNCERYRLTRDQILRCADDGYGLGFRTIVLQSGEDPYYTDEMICDIVSSIKKQHLEPCLSAYQFLMSIRM